MDRNFEKISNDSADIQGDITVSVAHNQSLKQRLMSISLSNVSAREWLQKRRETIQPWGEFLNTGKLKSPKSLAPLPKRIVKNIEKFQSNYLFVFIGLVIFCVLTSPLLLVAIAACLGACYIISLKNQDKKITVFGREVSLAQQYAAVGACSFPLFWLAGAGSAVFWVIGASFFVIMLHASMYATEDEGQPFELEMEQV
ncbi:hypothetical protein CHS0354_042509 [Potamilus streckersoni]|uniref:PRA1 family protein n=1 Tax=Potamilus streckersoni TaxID=2493646 RepID=A0AAE0S9N2_9BIVA|nr:hypothetical protein CHS0354_042509 [Potamilus streckersoni]